MVERTTENRSEEVQFFPRTTKIKAPGVRQDPRPGGLPPDY